MPVIAPFRQFEQTAKRGPCQFRNVRVGVRCAGKIFGVYAKHPRVGINRAANFKSGTSGTQAQTACPGEQVVYLWGILSYLDQRSRNTWSELEFRPTSLSL